jgi:type IV pilus assembly protein PilN
MLVRFNLATKPLETHRVFLTLCAAVSAVAILSFLVLGWHVYKVRKADSIYRIESDNTSRAIERLSERRHELDEYFSRSENARLHDRAAFVNTIIDERSFNWTRMFMDLEKLLPGGVRVMSIEPKRVSGQTALKLTVGAANEAAKDEFLHALLQSDAFSHLQLVSVHAPAQDNTGDTVVLELTVIYSRA